MSLIVQSYRPRITGPVDPNWSGVPLLMHMNGAQGTQGFVDERGHPITVVGNASQVYHDTAQSVFGGASGRFAGGYLKIDDAPEFAAVGDFTFEFFARSMLPGQNTLVFSKGTTSRSVIQFFNYGMYVYDPAGAMVISGAPASLSSAFAHYALTKQGTTWRLFQGGVLKSSVVSAAQFFTAAGPIWIGSSASGYSFDGWLDEIRYTVGVARYTANFTPAAAPFPNA